jgi:tRNA threonylcarbamoyladenosine biosynthesis protein TsaB
VILALETATRACSAALASMTGVVVGEALTLEGPAHAQRLLPQVYELMQEEATDIGDLETVVVSLGPGAFTGLRIGVATARALAQASGAALGGVPTLEALAGAIASSATGMPEAVVPLIDGRRNELFAAVFRPVRAGHDAEWQPVEQVEEMRIVPADGLPAYLERWPGASVGGDGAVLHADRLPPGVQQTAVVGPTAAMVARAWAARTPGRVEGFAATLPVYGRRPDAVPRSRP